MGAIRKYVGFYLQRRKKWDGDVNYERPVVMVFNYQGKSLFSLTGLKVALCNWDNKRQRVKAAAKRSADANRFLDNLEERINDIYFAGLSEGSTITNAYILDRLKNRDTEPVRMSFWEYYDEYLQMKRTSNGPSTYRTIKSSKNRFKEYCDDYHPGVKFEDVTPKLLAGYNEFLLKAGNNNNTVNSQLKRLSRFMNYTLKQNLHQNRTFMDYRVKETVGTIKSLDMTEVKQLMDVKLTSVMEQKARDILLFGCFTGMRFSDIRNLKKADIREHRFAGIIDAYHAAHIRQVKTKDEIVVPLLPEAMAILNKYADLPQDAAMPKLALQVVNEVIKNVGKKAKLTATQKVENFKGASVETKYVEKWTILSTHIGRKTFITIAATNGLPINIVASITGQHPATIMKHYLSVIGSEKFKQLMDKMKFNGDDKQE